MTKPQANAKRSRALALAPLLICTLVLLTGCVGLPSFGEGGSGRGINQPTNEEPTRMPGSEGDFVKVWWTCEYSPTTNNDWHDDVLCTNGRDYDRPYLLSDWASIDYEDLKGEAQFYEERLNETRGPAVVPRD